MKVWNTPRNGRRLWQWKEGTTKQHCRQMIDCRAVGEGCSCFGCRLVGMTAMVSSIFEKMRLAGSAIYNGDILLLGFSSFAFLNYEIDDTYRKVHPDLLSCHFCSISMSFSFFFFFECYGYNQSLTTTIPFFSLLSFREIATELFRNSFLWDFSIVRNFTFWFFWKPWQFWVVIFLKKHLWY